VSDWAWITLKDQMGCHSWSDVPPKDLQDWAHGHNVLKYLPDCYKNINHGENQESQAESES
jgi:hypothetical protein